MKDKQRLRWGGNLEAQKQADAAFAKLRDKRKSKPKPPKRKWKRHRKPDPPKPAPDPLARDAWLMNQEFRRLINDTD